MTLNVQVSTILQQAANRRYDVKKCSFEPNPSTDDHTNRVVIVSAEFYPAEETKDAPKKIEGKRYEIGKKDTDRTVEDILDEILGKEPEALVRSARFRSKASLEDRNSFLKPKLGEMMER